MPGIDPSRTFVPVHIALLTVSDSRKAGTDKSGDLLAARIEKAGHTLVARAIVPDETSSIIGRLRQWIEDPEIDVVIATGGTGITGRDVTTEAFQSIFEKEIVGFGELFRWLSYQKVGTSTIQSRATAGVTEGTYLFAVPGSPGACEDAWDGILVHQLDSRHRPCNFVELMPRLMEHKKAG
jgi:molybdenum cofactor biosynthesis protein B